MATIDEPVNTIRSPYMVAAGTPRTGRSLLQGSADSPLLPSFFVGWLLYVQRTGAVSSDVVQASAVLELQNAIQIRDDSKVLAVCLVAQVERLAVGAGDLA